MLLQKTVNHLGLNHRQMLSEQTKNNKVTKSKQMGNSFTYSDSQILRILNSVKTIAIIGASITEKRTSHILMKYLQGKGYRIIPINPNYSGKKILSEEVYPSLSECNQQIDMVDVFLKNCQITEIAEESALNKNRLKIKCLWTQLGLINLQAHKIASAAGIEVIMDRCPKIEYSRLSKKY